MKTVDTLPSINHAELSTTTDVWDYLFLFINKYDQIISTDPTGEIRREFSDDQHTLMAFNALYGEVSNGGFLQLIHNGYGGYIFDNPFSKYLREWGANTIASIVDQANIIYQQHKGELEKEMTIAEFSNMYSRYTNFEPLDNEFHEVMEKETLKIKDYVASHISNFAVVIEAV